MAGKKLRGRVTFQFYEYPDGSWVSEIKHAMQPKKNKENLGAYNRDKTKMALLAADMQAHVLKTIAYIDRVMVTKKEAEIAYEEAQRHKKHQADVDRLQTKLPFEEEE